MTLSLSTVRPDHADLVSGLQEVLSTKASWRDLLTSSTGQTLLEMIAAIGTYDQFSIQQGVLNAFPGTATADSSIYAITQMLGIRLTRKSPVEVTVTVSVPSGSLVIDAYSQFSGAGSYWYNPDAVTVTSTPQDITLRQGLIKSLALPGTGVDYQAFISQERNFLVADQEVLVYINGTQIPVLTSGLWEAKGTSGVQDITLPDGRLGLVFGSDLFGSKPLASDVINIFYAVTSGNDATSLVTVDEIFSYAPNSTVSAVCTSSPTGGGDEKTPEVYKSVSSPLFGTFDSSVTRGQYIGTILKYPGVLDALTFAQREINPKSVTWMNLFRTVLLTETAFSATQQQDFLNWLNDRTMYSGRFFLETPVVHNLTITMEIYCNNTATLSQAKANVVTALQEYFRAKAGVLSKDVFRSDIIDAALAADSSIDYVILNSPAADVILSRQVIGTPTYAVSPTGTLPSGVYDYAIGYTSSFGVGGEIAPTNWVSVYNPTNSGSIQIDWEAVANVANYHIWGRQASGTLGKLATVANNVFTFTDNNPASPTPTPPLLAMDTQPIYYAGLPTANLTVTPYYSTRKIGSV